MNRITNEQREHIVREAVAQRDAILSGSAPRKLWLWKNFVDGKPEYWAFDNPYPTNLDNGDPQTLGQPCGYAIFKPSRDGSHGRTEEQVLREMASVASRAAAPAPSPEPREHQASEATCRAVLSDVNPVVLEVWKLQGNTVGAMLKDAQQAVIELQEQLSDAQDAAPPSLPETVTLSDEQIIEIAKATESAEPGRDGYVLPITFARAIESALLAHIGKRPAMSEDASGVASIPDHRDVRLIQALENELGCSPDRDVARRILAAIEGSTPCDHIWTCCNSGIEVCSKCDAQKVG